MNRRNEAENPEPLPRRNRGGDAGCVGASPAWDRGRPARSGGGAGTGGTPGQGDAAFTDIDGESVAAYAPLREGLPCS